jgi:hypothetical protein
MNYHLNRLLCCQQKRFLIFFNRYFGSLSPWDSEYVSKIFRLGTGTNSLKSIELELIHQFSNEGKSEAFIGYGENFRPYDKTWTENIAKNINLSQFEDLSYQANQRGIVIDNLEARVLPSQQPLMKLNYLKYIAVLPLVYSFVGIANAIVFQINNLVKSTKLFI